MNDPYVATNRGWRRKIGHASKYRFNDAPQNGEDGTLYGNHPGSRFTGQTKVGMMTGPRRESNFQTSLREAREISEANAAMERREKRITNQAKQAEAAKKAASTAPSSAEKNAAGVAAFGSGKPPAATQSAPQAPVMSREERNKIEMERRAKGRAKARLAEARSPSPGPAAKALADFNKANPNVKTGVEGEKQSADLRLKRQKELDSAKLTNAKWKTTKNT